MAGFKQVLVTALVGVSCVGGIAGFLWGLQVAYRDQAGVALLAMVATAIPVMVVGLVVRCVFEDTKLFKALDKWAKK